MKFKRASLIALIDEEITRLKQKTIETHQAAVAKHHRQKEYWLIENRQAWFDFAAVIETKLRESEPITADMRPEALSGGYSNTLPFFKFGEEPYLQAAYLGDLPAMKKLLEAVEDEEVSTSELQRLGFKVPRLFGKENV